MTDRVRWPVWKGALPLFVALLISPEDVRGGPRSAEELRALAEVAPEYIERTSSSNDSRADAPGFETSFVVRGSPETTFQILQDVEGYPTIFSSVDRVDVVSTGPGVMVADWVETFAMVELKSRVLLRFDHEARVVAYETLKDELPWVRGRFQVRELAHGYVMIDYESYGDPGVWMPRAALHAYSRGLVEEIARQLRHKVAELEAPEPTHPASQAAR